MDKDFLKISQNSDDNPIRSRYIVQLNDMINNEIQIDSDSNRQKEKYHLINGQQNNQREFSNHKPLKNSNSNSVHTQSSQVTKDCTISSQKIEYDFDHNGFQMKEDQMLDCSPLIRVHDKFHSSSLNENQFAKQRMVGLKEEAYFTFNSSNKKNKIDNLNRQLDQKIEFKTIQNATKERIQGIDLSMRKFSCDKLFQQPGFKLKLGDNLYNRIEDQLQTDKANMQIISQYQKEIRQIESDSNTERRKYQNEIDELQKTNKELLRKLSEQNQEYFQYQNPQKQQSCSINGQNPTYSFQSPSKTPENFSFVKITEANKSSNPEELKKQVYELKYENKELQLKIEIHNQEFAEHKQQFENILAYKQQKFDKLKRNLFNKCKLIVSQMQGMKNELQLLKEKTIEQRDKNQGTISNIDRQAFRYVYEEHQQQHEINTQHNKNVIQQLIQQLEEKDLEFQQYKQQISTELNEKNHLIYELEQKIELLEIQQQQELKPRPEGKKIAIENVESKDLLSMQQLDSLKSLTKTESKDNLQSVQSIQKVVDQLERQNYIPNQRKKSKIEEQLKNIQIESIQKYHNLEQKYNKMNMYYSDRLQQSDSHIHQKDLQLMQKDSSLQQKQQQIQEYQDIFQYQNQHQRQNKQKQIYIQKSLKDLVNNQSNQYLEYKRNSSQEIRRLQKELSQATLEKRKQDEIIEELIQIKQNQKEEIKSFKGILLNTSNNSSLLRQSNFQQNLSSRVNGSNNEIIKDNFGTNREQTTQSARQYGKKENELKDLMRQLNQVTLKNSNSLNKITNGEKYVPNTDMTKAISKNKDYFNEKQGQMAQSSQNQTLDRSNSQVKNVQKKITFFDHKDNNLSKMISDLDWGKLLQNQNNNSEIRANGNNSRLNQNQEQKIMQKADSQYLQQQQQQQLES